MTRSISLRRRIALSLAAVLCDAQAVALTVGQPDVIRRELIGGGSVTLHWHDQTDTPIRVAAKAGDGGVDAARRAHSTSGVGAFDPWAELDRLLDELRLAASPDARLLAAEAAVNALDERMADLDRDIRANEARYAMLRRELRASGSAQPSSPRSTDSANRGAYVRARPLWDDHGWAVIDQSVERAHQIRRLLDDLQRQGLAGTQASIQDELRHVSLAIRAQRDLGELLHFVALRIGRLAQLEWLEARRARIWAQTESRPRSTTPCRARPAVAGCCGRAIPNQPASLIPKAPIAWWH